MAPLQRGRKRRSAPEAEEEADASAQPSPEPPQRRRRTSPPSDSESDSSVSEANGNSHGDDSGHHQLVKKMVRFALACEYQRRPIRRAEISEKVLGQSGGRKFKQVFASAQIELRSVFGMEMTELPAKEKLTTAQKRAAAKSQSQASNQSKSWVLSSTLPPEFRDPDILPPLSAPTEEEDSKYTAIYSLLIALIMLSGGTLAEAKMERYMRRLGLQDNTPIEGYPTPDKLLKRMEKDGYLVKTKENTGTGEDDIYFTVGPRGKVEVSPDAVQGLARGVYGSPEDEAGEELDKRLTRSLGLTDRTPAIASQMRQQEQSAKRGRSRRDAEEDEEEDEEATDEE